MISSRINLRKMSQLLIKIVVYDGKNAFICSLLNI
ncbi:hypothetical protein X975_16831, partial [Stegodyphus mimosarum]